MIKLGPPPPAWKPEPGPPEGLERDPGTPGYTIMIPEVALLLCVVPTRLAAWRSRNVGPSWCRATAAANSAILYNRAEIDAVRASIDKALRAERKADNLARIASADTTRKRTRRR